MLTNCLHDFSVKFVWAILECRGPSSALGAGQLAGFEREGPVWDRFWTGERERLGFPLSLTDEEKQAELFRQWCEGVETSSRAAREGRGGGRLGEHFPQVN